MSASSAPARVLAACRDVRFRVVGGEGVVIRMRAGEVLVVNEVGARVLELLDGERTLGEVGAALAEEFEADPAELERDLERYAAELLASGVVEERG